MALGALVLSLAAAQPANVLQLGLTVTDVGLRADIQSFRRWKDYFVLTHRFTGEDAYLTWAAFYAGQEEYATRLYQEVYAQFKLPAPPIETPPPLPPDPKTGKPE